MSNWIQTFTNKKFAPLQPNIKDINIEDIAHALSNKCRFSGHTKFFYSVAQHSVLVSLICKPEDALWGLLHDASEGYLVDMPTPLKILPEFKWFVEVENKLQKLIAVSFGLDEDQPESVHYADKAMLLAEKRDLMPYCHEDEWQIKYVGIEPYANIIKPLTPKQSEKEFLKRFKALKK